ncbi:hypothetical protein ANCCEY_07777 [Ancylostoma ceylanicum]|uniref:Uncharacterized protein n=1 Tax=Ancylostoma ceylanicum TaxID=53326 RepID=A0A0D6LZS3_9BILA|nr:hypothetical protein ANCCEY_07777 [Ancylostoma ceylanicum]
MLLQDLLATLAQVLQTDHQEMKFNQCVLPQPPLFYPQHQVPTSSTSNSSYSSHNGQQAPANRFPHRENSASQPNMNAAAEPSTKQGYNNRDRDYRQNDRDWNRGDSSGPDQLTWQQREMERNDNYRERQGRREYNNYRQRQYNKYDDDREEPVPEDPRVDRNDDDGWDDEDYQAAGYHHDQQDYQHKHNRHYHRPYNNRGGFRGRGRGGFYHNRHYNRDDNRRDMPDDDRGDRDGRDARDGGDNRDRDHVEGNSRNNDRGFYRQGGKNYENNRSMDNDREKHSERSRVFYNSNKHYSDRRRRGSNSNYN